MSKKTSRKEIDSKPARSTSRLQRRSLRKIRANAKKRLNRFQELRRLDIEAKRSLLSTVRHHEVQLAAMDVYQDALTTLNLPLPLIPMLVTVASMYLYLSRRSGVTIGSLSLDTLGSPLTSVNTKVVVFTFMATLLINMLPLLVMSSIFSSRTIRFLPFTSFVRGWIVCCGVVYGVLVARLQLSQLSPKRSAIAAGLIGGVCFNFGTLALVMGVIGLRNWLRRRATETYPDAIITDCFLNILWKLERPAVHWVDVRFKGELIGELEKAASCMERSLPRRLRTGNLITDNWLKDRSQQMAAGVRSLIKWLYTPQLDTRDQFTSRVTAYLTFAASGDWDSFELQEPEKLSRPELIRTRARFIVTAIFSAVVPLSLLLLFKRLGVVAEPTLTYLTIGAYIWAALSLLASMDPNYSAKLTAMKDISSLLPFSKRKED